MDRQLDRVRCGLLEKMKALLAGAVNDNRPLSTDEQREWSRLHFAFKSNESPAVTMEQKRSFCQRWDKYLCEVEDPILPRLATQEHRELEMPRTRTPRVDDSGTWRDRATGETIRALGPHDKLCKEPPPYSLGDVVRAILFGAKNDIEASALSESTSGSGGALLPQPLSSTLVDRLRAEAVAFRLGCLTVPVSSASLALARITADPKPAWRSENELIKTTDVSFDRVTLIPRSCSFIVVSSRELAMDAPNFSDAITSLFARVSATEVDRVIFNGSGIDSPSAEPTGILNTAGVNEVNVSAALTSRDKLLDLVGAILDSNAPFPSGWASAPGLEISMAKLKTATLNSPLPEPELLQRIQQREITTALSDQSSPSIGNALVMGGFDKVLVGFREQVGVRVLNELYAEHGQVGFLVHLRLDVAITQPKCLARLINVHD